MMTVGWHEAVTVGRERCVRPCVEGIMAALIDSFVIWLVVLKAGMPSNGRVDKYHPGLRYSVSKAGTNDVATQGAKEKKGAVCGCVAGAGR